MAILNGRVGKLAVAGLGDFSVGVQQSAAAGAKYQIAMPKLKNGRVLIVGQTVQLDGEQLKVLSFGASTVTRDFVLAALAPV